MRWIKKSVVLKTVCAFFLVGGAWIAIRFDYQIFSRDEGCAFCSSKVLSAQTVYQGKEVLVLQTHKPVVAGHLLVIPIRHVERFEGLTASELVEIKEMIEKVDRASKKLYASSGYLLLQKNGKIAGQTVPHVHFHYIPRSEETNHVYLAAQIFIRAWLKPATQEEISSWIETYLRLDRDGF